ncbi:TetR/AcrR family transcriptional regulator [Seleniivibrio woodruffii]|uniref:TetR/AcrR family transcriptional regulator n=1 Tax=Seleniivibrio woodruffii TaxID=1078050 RepID=UPI0026ED8BEF|nr:TetR/AcrR family transcriptional regulator [Seleniivibrio woodruffii]
MSKALENYKTKRESIIKAGRELFLNHGYSRTSMDEVAKTACVTKQTVYRYFVSKSDLFAEVISQMSKENDIYTFGDMTPEKELKKFGIQFISMHMARHRLELFRMMIAESRDGSEIGGMFKSMIQDARRKPLTEFLSDRLSVKEADRMANLLITMLLSMRSPILMNTRDVPCTDEIEKHAETCVKLFLNGVKGF